MERLTQRKYGEIVSSKREKSQIHCSNFCNHCSRGAGDCNYIREMVSKLAEYEDAEEQGFIAKVMHGEWETVPNKVVEHGEIERRGTAERCSNCCHASQDFKKVYAFCPHCGAKMDDKEEAEQKLAEMGGE